MDVLAEIERGNEMKKYGCTAAGYDMGKIGGKCPWWQLPVFPIVPQIEWIKGDNYNANGWSFCWLWFRLWSLEHFSFELSIELEQTGLNVKAIIGWVRIVVRVIPIPYGWLDRFRRKPALDD